MSTRVFIDLKSIFIILGYLDTKHQKVVTRWITLLQCLVQEWALIYDLQSALFLDTDSSIRGQKH